MKSKLLLALAVLLAGFVRAEGPSASQKDAKAKARCHFSVKPAGTQSKSSDSRDRIRSARRRGRVSNYSHTESKKLGWLMDISYSGEEASKEFSIRCYFVGFKGKSSVIIGEKTEKCVVLKGKHETRTIWSPAATTTKRNSRRGSRRWGGRGQHSGTSGTKIAGVIMQVRHGGEIVAVYASNKPWERCAWKNAITSRDL